MGYINYIYVFKIVFKKERRIGYFEDESLRQYILYDYSLAFEIKIKIRKKI